MKVIIMKVIIADIQYMIQHNFKCLNAFERIPKFAEYRKSSQFHKE